MTSDSTPQLCIFLLQLGGPADQAGIEPFLRNLFEDVLPLPAWLRRPLAGWIARRRAPQVAPLYQELGGGSPLLANTTAQAAALTQRLQALGLPAMVLITMRYAPPRAATALQEARAHGSHLPWLALSLYPHYSYATSRSSLRELWGALQPHEKKQFSAICAYPNDAHYLAAMAANLEKTLATLTPAIRDSVHVVFSAHGLPLKLVREGDPYPHHIQQTVQGILQRLATPLAAYTLAYQSRVGPVKWLEPATQATLAQLGAQGVRHVVVVPIAFTSEHIETLHELDIQLRDVAHQAGIVTYVRAPTLACEAGFIDALAQLVLRRYNALKNNAPKALTGAPPPQLCCGVYAKCELAQYNQGA